MNLQEIFFKGLENVLHDQNSYVKGLLRVFFQFHLNDLLSVNNTGQVSLKSPSFHKN